MASSTYPPEGQGFAGLPPTAPAPGVSVTAEEMSDIQRRLSLSMEALEIGGFSHGAAAPHDGEDGDMGFPVTVQVPSPTAAAAGGSGQRRSQLGGMQIPEDMEMLRETPSHNAQLADPKGSRLDRFVREQSTSVQFNEEDEVHDACHAPLPDELDCQPTEIDLAYAELRLRDGAHRPYPYLLDTVRIFSYTKLRFYRKGSLSKYVGEICLFGATIHRPDPLRPIVHLKVPNFTYYLHARTRDEEDSLVTRIGKWISVANLPYTNRHTIFVTIAVETSERERRSLSSVGEEKTKGYVKEGLVKITNGQERAWSCSQRTKFSVLYLEVRTDLHQELKLSFDHTQLGLLSHSHPLRISDILGYHSGAAHGTLNIQLFERSRKHAGVMKISWDIAPERYLKLMISGSNVWRKDFVRPDPFFRIKKHSSNGQSTVIYRSEAYKNVAHPEFLPIQLSVTPAYVTKSGMECDKHYVMIPCVDDPPPSGGAHHHGEAGGSAELPLVDWVSEIVTAGDEKSEANKKLNLLRVMEGEFGRARGGDTDTAEITRRIVSEVEKSSKGKRSINDNDACWSTVSLSDTLTLEFWDNNISRSRRLTKPCLIGTLEITLRSILGELDLQVEECGELGHSSQIFRLVRSARYNDDEPPASEVTRGFGLLAKSGMGRQGRGGDCSNAQSTVLPTPEARMRALESKIKLHSVSLNERASFLHFIKGKWCAEIVMCVDFTQGAQQHHRQSRIVPSWNIFQMLMTHCMSFLSPYTGRGAADLYGFAGVQPSGEFQVFPIHRHTGPSGAKPEAPDPSKRGRMHMGSVVGLEDEDDCDDDKPHAGIEAPARVGSVGDHQATDLVGNALQLGYSRAKEQMSRLFDTSLPVFLLPVIRTAASRVREIARNRTATVASTTEKFFEALANFKDGVNSSGEESSIPVSPVSPGQRSSKHSKYPLSLLQMASYLDKSPLHTFGIGIVMIGSAKDIGDLEEAAAELRDMERSKVPFIFYMLFIDCQAPPMFSHFLNCITVDINSSPLLIQGSLHLLAKGLGFFPSRLLDFMRLHNVEPEVPERSYLSYFDNYSESEPADSEEDGESLHDSQTAEGSFYGTPVTSPTHPRPVVVKEGALSHSHPQHKQREEFTNTSAKFLQIFADSVGKTMEDDEHPGGEDAKLQAREELERGFPLSGTDIDKRYRKAVSTKGHEVFALVSEKSMPVGPTRGFRSMMSLGDARGKRDLKIVDLFMADEQLQKKEKADQRLREYLSEKSSRRRKSSGLAQIHSRLLKMREDEGGQGGLGGLSTAHQGSSMRLASRRSDRSLKSPLSKRKHSMHFFTRQARTQYDSSSTESSDSVEDSLNSHSAVRRRNSKAPTSLANVRRIARRGSASAGLAARQSLTQSNAEGEVGSNASDTDSQAMRELLSTAPREKGDEGPHLREQLREGQPTFYAYEGERAGAIKPYKREYDVHSDYRSLGSGLKVDWRLERAKQVELKNIMKEVVHLHAGPPIEQRSRQEARDEVRRVSSLASMQSVFTTNTPHRPSEPKRSPLVRKPTMRTPQTAR